MVSQTFFTGYYIFIYLWFVVGVILIGVPAVRELISLLTRGGKR
jgi:hypothetical protein